ncbi:MAG: penicillin-binding protein 1A [Brevundimonas sp.]|uniref:penicillin-binding protein 1A n=1 Tax=Brevundimonas sp. TaxID=1871086 RepID=UPI003919C8DA
MKSIAERWFVIAGIGLLGAIAVAGVALAVYAALLFRELPDAAELAEYRPPTATRVYAWDGTLIGEFSQERRIYVPYEQIPPVVVQAFLAAEDRNFFQHGGVDVGGLGRAAVKNVANAAQGRRLEGGSTITQQVAKNILVGDDPTIGRKLREGILASRLEATISKERILELYLNEIFLGFRSYGVAAAAYNYFGKPLNQLTIEEAAFLAALPKGPNNYHPQRRRAQATARRNWIINEMQQIGWITREQAEAAIARPLATQEAPRRAQYADADFFVEEARRRALSMWGDDINAGGYYMRTTLDPRLQSAARDALMRGLESYDRRHGWRGAWGTAELDGDWRRAAREGTTPAERRTWEAAIIESVEGSSVRIRTAESDRTGLLEAADVTWARAGRGLNRGDLIFVEPSSGERFNLRQVPAVNGALVAIEPTSGRVLAMVGGYSFGLSSFNRATQALRQPGSAFKPFVYATALENGFTPASIVLDAPISYAGSRPGERWSPSNYSRRFYGPQTLRRGLELSRNVMTVRMADRVGMRRVADDAVRYGVVDEMTPVLSMALGAGETTPYRLTAAYASFVNGGRRIDPYLIEMVQDRNGSTVYRADRRECAGCARAFDGNDSPRLAPRGEQVMDPVTAYQLASMMEGVVQRGTAVRARELGPHIGGKTGTTNEYRSAWFVGFSADIVVGVFIGFDDNRSLGSGEAGSATAVPVFIDFMRVALQDRPARPLPRPANAEFRMVNGIEEAFRPGTVPVREERPETPSGPIPYLDVLRQEREALERQQGQAPPPQSAPPPPPRKDTSEDLRGLF